MPWCAGYRGRRFVVNCQDCDKKVCKQLCRAPTVLGPTGPRLFAGRSWRRDRRPTLALPGPDDCASIRARMKPALRVVPVTDERTLSARADEWTTLLARSASNRHTQTPLWLLAGWRVFGGQDGRRIASALVYDGERLVGLAPMLRRVWWHRRAIPFRR